MKKESATVTESIQDFLFWVLKITAFLYILLIGGAMPFYYSRKQNYTTIGTIKAKFFMQWGYALFKVVLLALSIYVVLGIIGYVVNKKKEQASTLRFKKWLEELSLTDRYVILYMAALTVSFVLSPFKEFAIQGATGWFMGYVPQMAFACSYLLISRVFTKKSATASLSFLLLISSGVFMIGILNRYGLNPLKMESSGPIYISTIGNINWYCGYWAVFGAVGMTLFVLDKGGKWKVLRKILTALVSVIAFTAGITQGSDSGIVTLAVLLLLLGVLSLKSGQRIRNFAVLLALLGGASFILFLIQKAMPEANNYRTVAFDIAVISGILPVAGLLFTILAVCLYIKPIGKGAEKIFCILWKIVTALSVAGIFLYITLLIWNTRNPGKIGILADNPLFMFGDKWGSARGATWRFGMLSFKSLDGVHKMFGAGPDCMAAQIYQSGNEALTDAVKAFFGNSRLTNAHNEWITILVNTGILGLASWALLIAGTVGIFLKQNKSVIAKACGMALLCYTVHNIFSFQTMNNITQMYMMMGIGAACIRGGEKEDAL